MEKKIPHTHHEDDPKRGNTSILGLLGLAIRARRVSGGAIAAEKMIRSGKARLILLASDSAPNTKRAVVRLAHDHAIPVLEQHSRDEYGACFDGEPKAVVAILDPHMARGMLIKAGVRSPRTGKPRQGE
jgi:ribosomal protein L7Ae-like RNA K-turn-binding protein